MLSLFSDMAEGILAAMGEDAFFAGATETTKINIERGVELGGLGSEQASYRGDLIVRRDVATILVSLNPRTGQTFTMALPGGARGATYKLEELVEDNGATRRFAILKVS